MSRGLMASFVLIAWLFSLTKAAVDTSIEQPTFRIESMRTHAEVYGRFDFEMEEDNVTVVQSTTAADVGMTFPLAYGQGPMVVKGSKAERVRGSWKTRPRDRALRLAKNETAVKNAVS
jgi:hypothetical protein